MAAVGPDIEIHAGASAEVDVVLTDADGSPVDISGARVTFEVRHRASRVRAFVRRNALAGGAAEDVVQPIPGGGGFGSNSARVNVQPTDTKSPSTYEYVFTAEWTEAVPPTARKIVGVFRVL